MRISKVACMVSALIGVQASWALAQPTPAKPAPAPAVSTAVPPPTAAAPAPTAATATPAAATPAPAPAAAPEALPPAPPPPVYAEPAAACMPACRSGFTCVSGQCVSACNPPCGLGETCTEAGACVSRVESPQYNADMTGDSPLGHPSGYEQHDGFMLRLTLGLGGGVAKLDDIVLLTSDGIGEGEFEFSGLSRTFSLDLGGSVAENLIIHGRLADQVLVEPKVSINSADYGDAKDLTVVAILLAPAVTYYFMPANIYLTGAIGASWISVDFNNRARDSDDTYGTDLGLGVNVDVGKEWWVDDNWGLGVAGRFWLSAAKEENDGRNVKANFLAASVVFSATYQ